MKDIRIDNRMQRVFILKETDDRIVYIPVKALLRIDYDRLLKIEKDGKEMLDTMSKATLDNGINALVQYDNLIQVMMKTKEGVGQRLRKPDEPEAKVTAPVAQVQTVQVVQQEVQERRKPGPRPKPRPEAAE